jgi:hypothetical protein
MIKKTLASLVLGTSLLFGTGKAETINVPVNHGTNLQQYIDSAQSGDTLNFVAGNTVGFIGSGYVIDKDLNIDMNGYAIRGMYNSSDGEVFKISGNSKVTFEEANIGTSYNPSTGEGIRKILNLVDNSSMLYMGVILSRYDGIYSSSTGNIGVNKVYFDTGERVQERKIVLENLVGEATISECTFTGGGTAIYVGKTEDKANLNILNNTIDSMKKEAIYLNENLVCQGKIANNSISNTEIAIRNEGNLGAVDYTNNNVAPTSDAGFGERASTNFSFNPLYVDENSDNFNLQDVSPLWDRGLRIEGKTDYFTDRTWIGAYGSSDIPEPNVILLGLTGLGFLINRRKI